MGRPPCCDKIGVKKGPWTPEEDIMLVSYVKEHGPGNWRAVPTNTGLRRCSKSCRLRWTNYLRPGIKRGSFTDQEEKMIIQLQALLGNKWAAIALYLPERTDNDIKNYWNTHLKKKLKKSLTASGSACDLYSSHGCSSTSNSTSRGQWERALQADINTAKQALQNALSLDKSTPVPVNTMTEVKPILGSISNECDYPYIKQEGQVCSSIYASSTENIARLLKGWVKSSSTNNSEHSKTSSSTLLSCNNNNNNAMTDSSSCDGTPSAESKVGVGLTEAFESLFGFESYESSSSDQFSQALSPDEAGKFHGESKQETDDAQVPLSEMLESWLLDENTDLF